MSVGKLVLRMLSELLLSEMVLKVLGGDRLLVLS